MKRISYLLAIAVFIGFASCNKTNDPQPSGNTTTNNDYYFNAKVDGVDWWADMQTSNTSATSHHQGSLTIQAALTHITAGVYLINLFNYTGAGTYTVGTVGGNSYARYTTGTVTITKDESGMIEGTLSFEGYSEETKDTKQITDGKFRMKKQ